MKKTLFLLALLILMLSGQKLYAQSEESSCSTRAWVTDKDPKGLNVRSQPNTGGKILAALKTKSEDDAIMVNVVGYSNGWVKISGASSLEGDDIFFDIGWVSAKMIATGVKGMPNYDAPVTLYAAAKTSSKKIGTIPSESTVKIAGISCGWLKIEFKGKIGWIKEENICGNPVTTCS